jgi:hypothetical protein
MCSSGKLNGLVCFDMAKSPEGKAGTEKRRDAGLTKMLSTPPKPHKDMKKGKARAKKAENDGA